MGRKQSNDKPPAEAVPDELARRVTELEAENETLRTKIAADEEAATEQVATLEERNGELQTRLDKLAKQPPSMDAQERESYERDLAAQKELVRQLRAEVARLTAPEIAETGGRVRFELVLTASDRVGLGFCEPGMVLAAANAARGLKANDIDKAIKRGNVEARAKT